MSESLRLVLRLVVGVAVFLSVSIAERVAQACRHCGRASCPCYQVVEKTVYLPTMVPETRVVTATEYRCETRQRPVTVYRCVPEVRQVRQTYTAMVPQTRVRERVCLVNVPVMEEVDQTYTVCVPHRVVRQGVRRVCRPVVVEEMQTVCKDLGQWEPVTCVARPVRHCGLFGLFSCGGCAPVACCTQMVWVPNIVEEQVPVKVCRTEVVEEPCEIVTTEYRQEQRVRRVQVCRFQQQERRYQVQEVVCVPEQRERICNVTTYRREAHQVMQSYTVAVPHQVQREVQVMVCQMVPKQVCCRVPVSCCGSGGGK
jgi:hypothetical protein